MAQGFKYQYLIIGSVNSVMPNWQQATAKTKDKQVLRWHIKSQGHNELGYVIIPPASTKLKGGYTGFTLSVCQSVDRIVSALYLQQYSSDPFHICTSYQATSEGVSRVMFVSKFEILANSLNL